MTLAVTMPRGTNMDIKVTVSNKDLTGAAALFTVVQTHGGTLKFSKTTVGGGIAVTYSAPNSLVTVHLLPENTGTVAVGQYLWQLRTTVSAVQEIIEQGTLTLTDNDTYGL